MDTRITLKVKDGKMATTFSPKLDITNAGTHINNALNTMPTALLNMFATLPLLRPACGRERNAHVYVFSEDEMGQTENKLYKYRKDLYDATVAVFSQLLSTAFPDIEYIETCKAYQQNFCMDNSEEDVKAYKKELKEVTKYVRENFKDVLAEVSEDV